MTSSRKTPPGKAWGLRRLAGSDGTYSMLATDQRPPIFNLTRGKRGEAEARFEDVAAVKELLVRHLAPHASAVLIDPLWGYDRCIAHVSPRQGLLITLEDHAFTETPAGRISDEIEGWSAERIRRIGGDGVKLLVWYRPDAAPGIVARQQAFVRRVGAACRDADICLLLELLVYPLGGDVGYAEDPAKHPQLVIDSVRTFADPRYGVDLFKLESPLPADKLPDPGSGEPASRAQALFDALGQATGGAPWVMLSAGASATAFSRVLSYAYRAGASGYLAGRAIWWPAMQAFPDLVAAGRRLDAEAVPFMREINTLTARSARRLVLA